MRFNPLSDPFVKVGYLGYCMLGVALRQPDGRYQPCLEVRDERERLIYERRFPDTYPDADGALRRATGKGHQVIEDHLAAEMEETVGA